jgi:hypothetical protein
MELNKGCFITMDPNERERCSRLAEGEVVFVTRDFESLSDLSSLINIFEKSQLDFGVIRNSKKGSYTLVRSVIPDETIVFKNGEEILYSDYTDAFGKMRNIVSTINYDSSIVAQWWLKGKRIYFDGGFSNGSNEAS